MSTSPVLSVKDLNVRFNTENGIVHAVRGVNFDLYPGKTLGIVGESGSGKSVASMAIMGLHPTTADITGSIMYNGTELLGRPDGYMSRIRGSQVAMVFQDPLSALTPVYTVGAQIVEALRIHQPGMSEADAHKRAVELLDLVGIPNPQVRAKAYPHEFSGGMRQRAVIAIAIANDPDLIIADEPTTALDVTIQAQILDVLRTAQKETGAGVIMITHDLGVVAGMADRVAVMYAGRIVETGDVDDIFYRSRMPYTIGLLGSLPRLDARKDSALATLEGNPPSLLELPRGCPFIPRCPMAQAECAQGEPELALVERGGADGQEAGSGAQYSACHRRDEIERDQLDYSHIYPVPALKTPETMSLPHAERPEVLRVTDLVKEFPLMKGAVFKRRVGTVHAVDGVSFDVRRGETLALVGESGCGKTTTLMEVLSLQGPQEGTIVVLGKDTADLGRAQRRQVRRDLQIVFQDPLASPDPRLPAFFGPYGGQFVPELLIPALDQLEDAFIDAQADPAFAAELETLMTRYLGRPTAVTELRNLPLEGNARILLKREDLVHGGAHKGNQVLGQALLAKRMGKRRIIAETGAGQHGTATAMVCALLGLDCTIYMGATDVFGGPHEIREC